jgi:copper homeostasis protein CutC
MTVDVQAVRNAQAQGIIKGLAAADGTIHVRLELDEFIQDVDMTNLYLLAMIDLMQDNKWQDAFSWFQMGGEIAVV